MIFSLHWRPILRNMDRACIRQLAIIGFAGTACLSAGRPRSPAEAAGGNTERIDLPSGGTLRLANSIGVLTVLEALDRPDVEITTIKSTKMIMIPVSAPRWIKCMSAPSAMAMSWSSPRIFQGIGSEGLSCGWRSGSFDLEYRIKAPGNARVIANHHVGEVNIVGLVGDIDAHLQGQINLFPRRKPVRHQLEKAFGSVYLDFSGPESVGGGSSATGS